MKRAVEIIFVILIASYVLFAGILGGWWWSLLFYAVIAPLCLLVSLVIIAVGAIRRLMRPSSTVADKHKRSAKSLPRIDIPFIVAVIILLIVGIFGFMGLMDNFR